MQNSEEPDFQQNSSSQGMLYHGLQRLGMSADDSTHAMFVPAIEALGEAISPSNSLLGRLAAARKATQSLDRIFANRVETHANGAIEWPPHHTLHSWAQRIQTTVVDLLHNELLPLLGTHGIQMHRLDSLSDMQRELLYDYFQGRVYPLLTPLAVDPGHPFPFISTNSLNLLVEVRRPNSGAGHNAVRAYARLKLPRACPLLIATPSLEPAQRNGASAYAMAPAGVQNYVWTSSLITHHINDLFTGIAVDNVYLFRLLRAAEPSAGLGNELRSSRGRNRPVARLDVEEGMPSAIIDWLVKHLQVEPFRVLRYPHIASTTSLPELIENMSTLQRTVILSDGQHLNGAVRTSVAA